MTALRAGAGLRRGLIEGVLLLGESLGAPADRFGWCIALPGTALSVTAWIVIPATHPVSAYSALLAITAWANWHELDQETTEALDLPGVPPAQARRDADRHGADVHVLNVARTGARSTSALGTGKPVAPHVRRGHWRRQRYGTGN